MFGNITEHLAWDVIVPVILSIVGFLTSFTVGTKPESVDGLWGVGGVWIGKVPSDLREW